MAWLITNWRTVLVVGLTVALCLAGALIYRAGKAQAELEATAENLRTQNAALTASIEKYQAALNEHTVLTERDAAQAEALNLRIIDLHEYGDTLQDRDSECLSGPDVDRLRNLWNPGDGTDTTPSAPG